MGINNNNMKIIKTVTDTENKPFVLVQANDSADAEIFAQDNAAQEDDYFDGMEAGTATETENVGVYHVPFN